MIESLFIDWRLTLIASFAMIGFILNAIGVMLGIVSSADGMKHVATVLGVVMVLVLSPYILMNAWSQMSLWQRMTLIAVAIGLLMLWKRAR